MRFDARIDVVRPEAGERVQVRIIGGADRGKCEETFSSGEPGASIQPSPVAFAAWKI